MPILHVYWPQYSSCTLGKNPTVNGLIELPLSYRDIVYMTCIVDYIDTFVNSYYQNIWTCVTLLKLFF